MNDKLAAALAIIRAEFGLETLTVWAPDDDDGHVKALFFAKDDNALMVATISYVTGDKVELYGRRWLDTGSGARSSTSRRRSADRRQSPS